jgi:ubiquinone/menaquinone biosynthesis C-methylase UbiE
MTDRRKQIVASAYDRIAHRYLGWASAINDKPRQRMVARFTKSLPPGSRVLELGCGAGVPSTRDLARQFDVVGVDISAVQVELARQNVPEAEFIQGDFTKLRFQPASFDGVVALYAISHVPRRHHGRLFADVLGWLTPGGLFLATLGGIGPSRPVSSPAPSG